MKVLNPFQNKKRGIGGRMHRLFSNVPNGRMTDDISSQVSVLDSALGLGLSVAVASGVIGIEQVQEIQLRVRIRDLTSRLDRVEAEAIMISADPNRSPTPPPVYDSTGNRINTRAMRMRRVIEKERNELVEEILTLNPLLRVLKSTIGFIRRRVFTIASINARSIFRRISIPIIILLVKFWVLVGSLIVNWKMTHIQRSSFVVRVLLGTERVQLMALDKMNLCM